MSYKEITVLLVIVTVLTARSKAENQQVKVEKAAGAIALEKTGTMTRDIMTGHILIKLNTTELFDNVEQIREAFSKVNGDLGYKIHKQLYSLDQALHDTRKQFEVEEQRSKRWAGIISGFLGLYNMWEMSNIKAQEESTRTALRTTVHTVEAIRKVQATTTKNLEWMNKKVNKMSKLLHDESLRRTWDEVVQPIQAFVKTARLLLQHQLSPEILELVDLRTEYNEFERIQRRMSRRPALERWQDIFHCEFSMHKLRELVMIAIHIPVIKRTSVKMELYRVGMHPLVHEEKAYYVKSSGYRLAVSHTEEELMEITKEDLEDCIVLGKDYFCDRAFVIHKNGRTSCLANLYKQDWERTMKTCEMYSRQMEDVEAWNVNRTTFAVMARQPTLLFVTCPEKAIRSVEIVGFNLITLGNGCQASSGEVRLVAGQGSQTRDVSVTIKVTNVTKLALVNINGDEQLSLERPQPVESSEQLVEQQLLTGSKGTTWFMLAMILAGIALIMVCAVIAYAYWRWKKFQLPATPPRPTAEP